MNSNNFASNFMSVRMNQVIFSLNIKTDWLQVLSINAKVILV